MIWHITAVRLIALIIILDAALSLWRRVPNNHDVWWLELGRWIRLACGVALLWLTP